MKIALVASILANVVLAGILYKIHIDSNRIKFNIDMGNLRKKEWKRAFEILESLQKEHKIICTLNAAWRSKPPTTA